MLRSHDFHCARLMVHWPPPVSKRPGMANSAFIVSRIGPGKKCGGLCPLLGNAAGGMPTNPPEAPNGRRLSPRCKGDKKRKGGFRLGGFASWREALFGERSGDAVTERSDALGMFSGPTCPLDAARRGGMLLPCPQPSPQGLNERQ